MKKLKSFIKPLIISMAAKLGGNYSVGPDLTDALRVGLYLNQRGYGVTLGYWNIDGESPAVVLLKYLEAIDALYGTYNGYLSVKAPALNFEEKYYENLVQKSRQLGLPIHFDSLWPESAEETFSLIQDWISPPYIDIGCTLPGRWQRSLADADLIIDLGLNVRVVKGEWADPQNSNLDMSTGFLNVVKRLSGKARCVRIATHDPLLAKESLRILKDAKTYCELEILYGFPAQRILAIGREMKVPIRVYVPYGKEWLDYCLTSLKKKPVVLVWLLKDFLSGNYLDRFPRCAQVEGCLDENKDKKYKN